ncbi:MAG TPA: MerR family DNA-binding transcriptional regulator [Candidatus Magasanikbacteria bacterium]|nr:MerR family DNA-binding transcriptional regulator [Candidatus Magasanikbacteria bacterium]
MNGKKVKIGEAAQLLNVTVQTLRNWEKSGKLRAERSEGSHRLYDLKDLNSFALDLKLLAFAWATSAIPPDLPNEYYCERPDRFTSRVAKMGAELQKAGDITEDLASLLTLVAGEIGDNSFAHNVGNWPDTPGIFYGYSIEKRVIVLADRGRGVKTTLQQVRPNLTTDVEALNVAFTEIVSGRNPEKRGNGLKVVRAVAEQNTISLLFRSGLGLVTIPMNPGPMKIVMSDGNIRGTFTVIQF